MLNVGFRRAGLETWEIGGQEGNSSFKKFVFFLVAEKVDGRYLLLSDLLFRKGQSL